MKFFDSLIASVHRETADAVSIYIIKPHDYPPHLAGQYCAVEMEIDGHKDRRSYSFSNTTSESYLRLTIKEIEGGVFSKYFNKKASSGMKIRISEPQGNFVLPKTSGPCHLVFVAGGSGITPCFSMISSVLSTEPQSRVTLFFSNKTSKDVIFRQELERLSEAHSQFRAVFIFSQQDTESPLEHGRIEYGKMLELMEKFCRDAMSKDFFLCGPGGMIDSAKAAILDLGFSQDSIHTELFKPTGTKTGVDGGAQTSAMALAGTAKVSAILDSQTFDFNLDASGDSILDTLLDMGADAPYACKGGVCTSCKAKLMEGTVHMDDNYALTKKEIAAGYILTCQSHPTSDRVVLTYDGI